MERVLSKLEAARRKRCLSLEEVAKRVGVNRSTLSRWERGEAKPHAVNLRQLCAEYGMSAQELGFSEDNDTEIGSRIGNGGAISEYIAHKLGMRLSVLAFSPLVRYQVLHATMITIIKEATTNMDTKKAQMTRREALCDLVTISLVALNLTSFSQGATKTSHTEEVLSRCAAGIAASEELSKSNEYSDMTLAYDGVLEYSLVLKAIIKKGPSEYRQRTISLIAQCARVKALLSWHLEGAKEAILHGKEAVDFAHRAEDATLEIDTLSYLTWVYYYAQQYQEALNTNKHARSLLQKDTPVQLQSCIYSEAAIMQAAAEGQRNSALLEKAATKFFSVAESEHKTSGEFGKPELILNDGMAHYLWGDYDKALDSLGQLINVETLNAKMPLPGRSRIEGINIMTLSMLKSKERDMDKAIRFWTGAVTGAKNLRSEQRFNETRYIYDVFECVWPNEQRIKELRDHIVHW
jgi:transcriptional regulator with XRE-family HTH domain/tetratricopeptide (TPR) repeat protein